LFYTVYKITNNINGKYYIGKHQTKDLDDGYMGSGKLIRRAIGKYGSGNFTKKILHVFDNEEEMNAKEAELVIVSEETYNLCEGGQGGFGYINKNCHNNIGNRRRIGNYGWKNIDRSCSKHIEKIKKGIKNSSYVFGSHWIGKKHKEESKQKISKANAKAQAGKRNSQYGTCWITNGNEVKKIPLEALDNHLKMGYIRGRK